jgi:hypothetical protein
MPTSKAKVAGLVLVLALAAWPTGRACAQGLIPGAPAIPPSLGGLGGGIPGLSGAGAVPGLAGAAGVPGAAAAAPRTLFGFFGLTKANLAACRAQICGSPIGQIFNSMLIPVSGFTGGVVSGFCPTVPTDAQAAALAAANGPTSPQAVAAKIQQDEAQAAARRAAVKYLSTVSCHYWPEAEAALIVALRDDRNECVRYEAALALLNGCCCTEKTIEALNIVVTGSEKDGKPSEQSERVKATAFAALQRCLLCYQPPAKEEQPPERPEPLPLERPGGVPAEPSPAPSPTASARPSPTPLDPQFQQVAYYYTALKKRPPGQVIGEARATVTRSGGRPPVGRALRTGERSLYHALARAAEPVPARPASRRPPVQPAGAALAALTPRPSPQSSDAAPPPPVVEPAPPPSATVTAPAAASAAADPGVAPAWAEVRDTSPRTPAPSPASQGPPPTGRRNLRDIFFHSISPANGR